MVARNFLSLQVHPHRGRICLKLGQNRVLRCMTSGQWGELEPLLTVARYGKGHVLVHQGDEDTRQIFVVEGTLKRMVSNRHGRHMILRFSSDAEIDASYAARAPGTTVPYSIVAATSVQVAEIAMRPWIEFLDRHAGIRKAFEAEVMKVMSEVMAHCIELHLHDAPERLLRYQSERPSLGGPLSDKDVAAYLNLTPETISRMKQKLYWARPR